MEVLDLPLHEVFLSKFRQVSRVLKKGNRETRAETGGKARTADKQMGVILKGLAERGKSGVTQKDIHHFTNVY